MVVSGCCTLLKTELVGSARPEAVRRNIGDIFRVWRCDCVNGVEFCDDIFLLAGVMDGSSTVVLLVASGAVPRVGTLHFLSIFGSVCSALWAALDVPGN